MVQEIDVGGRARLTDYERLAHLVAAVQDLRREAQQLGGTLEGRRVWMVNSTARGGGVAEMLPKMVALLRDLGVDVHWLVIGASDERFFQLTKHLHNLVHGAGPSRLGSADRELYEAISRENAEALAPRLAREDILVVHDPQPFGMGAMLRERIGLTTLWRCHIGLDERNAATAAAWQFLDPYAGAYDHAVFSAPEYIPDAFANRASIIHPAIDPLSQKNRDLPPHKLQGVLCNAALAIEHAPVLTPPFPHPARRWWNGEWVPANEPEELGLLFRPTVVQISRWDRLKGFVPLLEAFVRLKSAVPAGAAPVHRRRLEILRLVLAGPDPASVADDPEGLEVVAELTARYDELPEGLRRDVALLSLPMVSRKENALMVNALQRCASIVVQNSLREGFGLTCTEAMWKRQPVVGSRACGLRQQIRDGVDGCLVDDPEDSEALAAVLGSLLADAPRRELLASSAQRRVHAEFLVFRQLGRWLETLAEPFHQHASAPVPR